MKRENRKPTRAEWSASPLGRTVVRRIAKPEQDEEKLGRIASEDLDAHLEDEEMFRRERSGA